MAEKGAYTYDYPRPMVTVDALVFTLKDGKLEVLLIKRGHAPFLGMWALPGGFVEMDEPLETAVARELAEETGVTGVRLEQFGTFGDVDRDPRGRVITIAYLGFADWRALDVKAGDDAGDAAWFDINNLPQLASDHNMVIARARRFLRVLTHQEDLLADLVPTGMALDDLMELF